MSLFNIIDFKRKVVCFVDSKAEVLIIKVLRSDSSTTLICLNSDFWLLNNFDGITKVSDFTKVVVIRNCVTNSGLAESKLHLFGVNYWAKIAIRQVVITRCSWKSHNPSPIVLDFLQMQTVQFFAEAV
jgi:hypothetical protein